MQPDTPFADESDHIVGYCIYYQPQNYDISGKQPNKSKELTVYYLESDQKNMLDMRSTARFHDHINSQIPTSFPLK